MDAKQLREVADGLFSKKAALNSLHQEIADNFYPERADFTITRSYGTDFAAQLMTSYPLQCRRDLGNQFAAMLRPTARPWFHPRRKWEKKDSADVRGYLEWFEQTQRRAMYDDRSLLTRATKEGDHDYAAFGQLVMSVELNRLGNGLLYRTWHLRDVVWSENEEGQIGFVARRWKTDVRTLARLFKNVHQNVTNSAARTPFEEVHVLHLVVDADMYDDKARGRPRFSVWYDTTNEQLLEATPIWGRHYIIPRWQTVSGSQYSYSPATVCALPDARLIQAMTFTLLEASEKAASPPMLATKDAIRGDVALYANGITWVDQDYDERTGEALRPLTQDFRGFEYGVSAAQDTRTMINAAFFLNKLSMPQRGGPQETAYEVGQRVQQYIRDALPIFEPTEMEYNAPLCDESFELLWRNGAFGPVENWPKELRERDGLRWTRAEGIGFEFESPLHDVIEQQKGQILTQGIQLIGPAIGMDPAAAFLPKAEVALRDALEGIGWPATWLNNQQYVEDAKRQQAAQTQQASRLQALESASNSAKNLGMSGMVPAAPAAAGVAA